MNVHLIHAKNITIAIINLLTAILCDLCKLVYQEYKYLLDKAPSVQFPLFTGKPTASAKLISGVTYSPVLCSCQACNTRL